MKYGYVLNILDTPENNIWTVNREIVLNDNSIVYGCEGNFDIPNGLGEMFTQSEFKIWLSINQLQSEDDLP
jgi:hypothetical protein